MQTRKDVTVKVFPVDSSIAVLVSVHKTITSLVNFNYSNALHLLILFPTYIKRPTKRGLS